MGSFAEQNVAREQARRASTRSLRQRRYRLTRAVARIQGVLAEIDSELAGRGIGPVTYKLSPSRIVPGLRHGEMAGLCMAVLRTAEEPLSLREIVARVAALKEFDQSDPALMARVTERASSAMEVFSRRKVVRIAGNPHRRKGARWELAGRESGD